MGTRIESWDGDAAALLEFTFDGVAVAARAGDTLAAALLAEGYRAVRRDTRNAPRGPYCLAGSCYECLVEINASAAAHAPRWQRVRACLTLAASGIEVRSAAAARGFE